MDNNIIPANGPQAHESQAERLQQETVAPRFVERRGQSRVIDQPAEPEISFIEIGRILRKRRWVISACTVAVFAAAVAYTFMDVPRYRATSIVEFNKENSDSLPLEDESVRLGGAAAMDYSVTQQTQVNALQSDTLALQVAHELSLEKRHEFTKKQSPLDYLRYTPDESRLPLEKAPYRRANLLKAWHKNLKVEPVAGTRMINVEFMSPDRDVASAVVNTLVNDYMDQYFRIRYAATVQASDWLSKQLDDLKSQVETSQQRLVDYQKQAGILGTDENHNIVMTRLEAIDREFTEAQSNRILTQTVWQLAKTGNPELLTGLVTPSATGTTTLPNSLALIENLRSQQNQLKMQYAEAASKYGSAYPRLAELQSELNEINASIQTEVSNLAGRAQNDYLAAQQNENSLHVSFENAKAEANKLNDSAVQYTILKHEVESSRDLYDGLQKKLKEAGVLASLRATNIVVVDPARPADRPARPIVPLNLAIGLFAGVMVGLGGAFVAENMDETIATPDDAENISQVPSLGFVPRWKGRLGVSKPSSSSKSLLAPGTGVLLVSRPHSQAAESYRSLRTSITQSMRRGQCNVLLVSSALPQEGKTTTSINCAAAFAQQGAKVLLVEADMRRPALCTQLNLKGAAGLSSLIAGERPSDLPLKVACIPKLNVIPAGPKPSYPAELLGSPRMEALIRQWRTEYDYVVIDTPPVLSVTDAAVLAPYCDAAIIVVRSGVTSKKSLQRVREIFKRTQTRMLGTVLNSFDVRSADYRSYSGYESDAKNDHGYYIAEAN